MNSAKKERKRKSRALFNETGEIKEIFHSRMGMIKHRNIKGLTEAEEVARNTDQLFFFLKRS